MNNHKPVSLSLIIIYSFIILTLIPAALFAQYSKDYNPFPVIISADTISFPFWGGINSPKPTLLDFDADSLIDLFLGFSSGKLSYFRNEGTQNEPNWIPEQERFADLDIGSWYLFCDIDGDTDFDLFCDNYSGGVRYFRNETIGQNISFTLIDTSYFDFATGVNNTPAFADLDNDSDFDFFLGDLNGRLQFFRNDGDSATANFVFADGFYDSVLAFPGGGLPEKTEQNHGFSVISFGDIDSDSDYDLFFGDIFNTNLYWFNNEGTASVSDLNLDTENYLPNATLGFNHVTISDLDNDNDQDMIVGAANGQDIDNLLYLINQGTVGSPNLVIENLNLISNIDIGRNSMPTLGDLDGDFDNDLLIGTGDGRLVYYENTGTVTEPQFEYITDFYQGIDVGLSAAPVLIDWDDDNDLDLLIGNDFGKIEYWQNQGNSNSFLPVLIDNQLAGIKVDILAIPIPVDLNDDNLTDLLVGEWDFNGTANILLYENIGTSGNPQLNLVTTALLNIEDRDFTVPQVYDWNDDGRMDLIIGERKFGVTLYLNNSIVGQFPDSTMLIPQLDTLPGIDDGYRVSLFFIDIDADADEDIFIGEEDGGLNFYLKEGSSLLCGDADSSDGIDISDAVYLINFIFGGGSPPEPITAGDADCSGSVDISDAVYLINFIFGGGDAPCASCP